MKAEEINKAKKLCDECKIVKLCNSNGELTFSGHVFIDKALTGWPKALDEIERLNTLLNGANQALKRAGSSARFHLKADEQPMGVIAFEEKEEPEDVYIRQNAESEE